MPVENLIGEENKGFKCIMYNFNHERWGFVVQVFTLLFFIIMGQNLLVNRRTDSLVAVSKKHLHILFMLPVEIFFYC